MPIRASTEIFKHVPDAEVPAVVAIAKKTPGYVSHAVIPEGGGLNTIVVNYQ